jgi:hypothetical protein
MRQYSYSLINQVGNKTITSATIDARQLYRISGQVIVGAGANTAGSMQLQYSCDPIPQAQVTPAGIVGVTNWNSLGTAVSVSGSAAAASILFSSATFSDIGYAWIRAVYTDTSSGAGLGLITVNLNFQGF